MNKLILVMIGALLFSFASTGLASDWPTWRHDAGRSGATDETLANELHLQWVRRFPAPRPAWPAQYDLGFDAIYEPIVIGKTLFVPSARNDSITAMDTESGNKRWVFHAGGPVRLTPLGHEGRIYFGCDDGQVYCIDAAKGTLIWKFDAAPSKQKVMGNDRLISLWPVRGGLVLSNNHLYFTSGIWPLEGVYLHSLDLASASAGAPTKHERMEIRGHPQGHLAAANGRIIVPVNKPPVIVQADLAKAKAEKPAVVKPRKGKNRGCYVATSGDWLFGVGFLSHISPKIKSGMKAIRRPVFTPDIAYATIYPGRKFGGEYGIQAIDLKGKKPTVLWKILNPVEIPKDQRKRQDWIKNNPLRINLKTGKRLFGRINNTILAFDLPDAAGTEKGTIPSKPVWKFEMKDRPRSMLAADGKLFISTLEGALYCFGSKKVEPKILTQEPKDTKSVSSESLSPATAKLLKHVAHQNGYALVLGIGSGKLVEELTFGTKLRVIAIDPNEQKVEALQRKLKAAKVYGTRVSVHTGDPLHFGLPPYLARLIVSEGPIAAGLLKGRSAVHALFSILRPYGGTACIRVPEKQKAEFSRWVMGDGKNKSKGKNLANAKLDSSDGFTLLHRVGSLPGAGKWEHEFGNAGNSLYSGDQIVRAPLGVLWFGGPAGYPAFFWNRHTIPPSALISNGRMIFQGPGMITAADLYTGKILWQTRFKTKDYDYPRTYHLKTALTPDTLYAAFHSKCMKMDPKTGAIVAEFSLPEKTDVWGLIRVQGDVLLVPAQSKVKESKHSPYYAPSLYALNRNSGKVLWKASAKHSFNMVAMGADRAYCFDSSLSVPIGGRIYGGYRDRGISSAKKKISQEHLLRAFDLKTGKSLWTTPVPETIDWLLYSQEFDAVVVSNYRNVVAFNGIDGTKRWEQTTKGNGWYGKGSAGEYITNIWKGWLMRQADRTAFSLKTGKAKLAKSKPGEKQQPWQFPIVKGVGCGYGVASEHLITYRHTSAAYTDLTKGTAAHLKGFRSGCRNSLIPADGVLCAPNFARGCICDHGIFTSLAFVHRSARVKGSDVGGAGN